MAAADLTLPVSVADIRRNGGPPALVADADQRAAIAARLNIIGVDRLDAAMAYQVDGDVIDVTGALVAQATQACVATGEPIKEAIEVPIAVRFVPMGYVAEGSEHAELSFGQDEPDIVEYAHGRIDIAAMVIDTLALALDPFPRSVGADAYLRAHGVKTEEEAGAFGALAGLLKRD